MLDGSVGEFSLAAYLSGSISVDQVWEREYLSVASRAHPVTIGSSGDGNSRCLLDSQGLTNIVDPSGHLLCLSPGTSFGDEYGTFLETMLTASDEMIEEPLKRVREPDVTEGVSDSCMSSLGKRPRCNVDVRGSEVFRARELLCRCVGYDVDLVSGVQMVCDQIQLLLNRVKDLESVTDCMSMALADADAVRAVLERKVEDLSGTSRTGTS